jgi:hypothetical protein
MEVQTSCHVDFHVHRSLKSNGPVTSGCLLCTADAQGSQPHELRLTRVSLTPQQHIFLCLVSAADAQGCQPRDLHCAFNLNALPDTYIILSVALQMRKAANRMNFDFNVAEDEYIDGDEVVGLGSINKEGSGRLRLVASQQKVTEPYILMFEISMSMSLGHHIAVVCMWLSSVCL